MDTLRSLVISIAVIKALIAVISKQSLAQETCSDHDFHLEFPSLVQGQYSSVNTDGDTTITAFTICVWLKTSDVSQLGLLRYSDQSGSNVLIALSLDSAGHLLFSLLSEHRQSNEVPGFQDGNWHGLCVTWENEDGVFMVYFDGRLLEIGNGFKSGNSLSSKGIFTLGIGSTDERIFSGRLGHVNAWPVVLEHPQLAVFSSKCGVERGEFVSWPQFRQGAVGINVIEGETCPFDEADITHQMQYWKLDGTDQDLISYYSATFLEGRLTDHKALYLDDTGAYTEAPFINLGLAFTIACWIKLLPSNPHIRPILASENGGSSNGQFWFGVNINNKLKMKNWHSDIAFTNKANDTLQEKQWLHVAVSFVDSVELAFFINGLKDPAAQVPSWQSPTSGSFSVGRFYAQLQGEYNYRYFHGFLSDLYVFSRALNEEEIGQLMGRSSPCTLSEWSSHPTLTPSQQPTEKYRTKSCPGIGQCKDVGVWRPADCREVLLAGNNTNGVYIISPLNNEDEFEVYCDQETQGGGWTVIQQRLDGTLSFSKTWNEYKTGFGTIGSQSEMWLGNEKIHSLTTKNAELLIELEAFDGSEGFAIYSDFSVGDEANNYSLSLGEFSGNLNNKLGMHDTAQFTVQTCAPDVDSSGWWFTESCGDVLLNSVYGEDTGLMKWADFPDIGDTGGKLKKTSMKIRRTKGYFGDYTLKFPEQANIIWPVFLTEFNALTVCLWHKLYAEPENIHKGMTLLRYSTDGANVTLRIKDFDVDDGPKLSLTTWNSTVKSKGGVDYPTPDGSWHHLCVSWTNAGGVSTAYMDDTKMSFSTIGDGMSFKSGGRIKFGAVCLTCNKPEPFKGEITYMNLWDKVLPEASIQNIAQSCGAETGNVLHWSFFAAMADDAVQYVPFSGCKSKELYHWNFDHSSTTDTNKNHIAQLTGARVSADQHSLVFEDQGNFMAENISLDLSNDQGFTVSFTVKQTVMASDILKDDFKSLEVLRSAFPTFIRDYAMWKRCYAADHSSWTTADFHSNCDAMGPTLTIIRVLEYVFGGFVEQSWGGTAADIGNQFEGFLFSLSNPSGQSPQIFPIQEGKTSARTDEQFGPSFGQRDLELFEDENGRLMGFSGLGASFDLTNISLSSSDARNFFAGSQRFYPDQVEVFYYHVPLTPVGIEDGTILDDYLTSSSVLNEITGAHLARLNELRGFGSWCCYGPTANEWLQVFLGKQYTLTHVALQGISGGYDVTALTVKYEKTKEGVNWMTYNKLINGTETPKVIRFNLLSTGVVVKEAFFPPFQAVKVQLVMTEQKMLCIKMELYVYDAGCSQSHGLEDETIPNEKLTASSTDVSDDVNAGYYWPFRGRLNHDAGSGSWGPYKPDGGSTVGNWFQVDLEQEQEVACITTQGRGSSSAVQQWSTKYQIAFSSEGNDWEFYEDSNGVKEFDANSDQFMAVTNWFVPSIYGRFIRVHITACNKYCRLRMELYGKTNLTEIYKFPNGLGFTIRRGRYHIFFAKDYSFWEIRHPLIVNQSLNATLTWTPNDGLKFFINGDLVASDKISVLLNLPLTNEPFKLLIGSAESGGGWSRSISIDDVSVWNIAMTEDQVKNRSEVYFNFDDNSRDWIQLVDSVTGWKLTRGCTETEGTGPCDDVSGGGRYIYFDASQSDTSARFVLPSDITVYSCLKFYYHMSGLHVGRLNVYTTDLHGNETLIWRLFGDQNDTWKEAHAPLNFTRAQYQIIFEALKGSSYLGDIAIDQITFTREECSLLPSSAASRDPSASGVEIKSSIIPMSSTYHQYVSLMLKEEGYDLSSWIPCYHALDHGWNVSTFHEQCDNKGPTLSIVRKDNYVFGGFTERSWEEDQGEFNFDLYFWRQNVDDYVWSEWSSPISQFSVSMWIKTSNTPFTLFSFGNDSVKIQFYIEAHNYQDVCIWTGAGKSCNTLYPTNIYPIDGVWHQLTYLWWQSSRFSVFIDGQYGDETEISNEIQQIPEGTLRIGQLQHPMDFPTGSFIGQITSFNMWDYKLDDSVIPLLAESCFITPGNVFQWNTFNDKVHGELKLVKPSICQTNNNPSHDVHFWRENSDDRVESTAPAIFPVPSVTISFWMTSSVQSSTQVVFSFGHSNDLMMFLLEPTGVLSLCFYFVSPQCSDIESPSASLTDEAWHQIVIVWLRADKAWQLYIDGISQGQKIESLWSDTSNLVAGKLSIGQRHPSLSQQASESFRGKITLFNVWNSVLGASEIAKLARSCRNDAGNVFSWSNLKNKVTGEAQVIEPSTCTLTNYKADPKAFIFSLNYTSQGALFKKEITRYATETAIYSSSSTGPTFGQAPFDFQIGISGNMKTGSSHHVMSYKGDSAESNLTTILAGASSFDVSDVEVLYKGNGGSLCTQQCPFYHYCDEISGSCLCNNQDKNPALCNLLPLYHDCSHFWLMDSEEIIRDLVTPGWGQSTGGVYEANGLMTDGINGEIHLNHEGDTCATKSADYICEEPGFTVSLFLKRWNRDDGERQTIFKSLGKFVVYQEANTSSLIFRVQRATEYCLKEIIVPEKIWSHLVFTYSAQAPQTLTVYRNGKKIEEFVRDEGCSMAGPPEFTSSSILLSSGDGVFAKAAYLHIGIWKMILPEERIAEIFSATKELAPYSVRVVAKIQNQTWHEDLKIPGTERYTSLTNDIESNVTSFYANHSGVQVSITVNEYRNGSVIADFTIMYNLSNYTLSGQYSLIEQLNKSISSTNYLYGMPLELQQLTPQYVPNEAPSSITVTHIGDTSIAVAWNDPSFPAEIRDVFQGYVVYIVQAESDQYNATLINEHRNFTTLLGLEPLVTYNISVAAYTLAGVGKQSEIIAVTTTFDAPPENITVVSVTSSCATIQWKSVPPEKFGSFSGYVVHYDVSNQSSFSYYKTLISSIHQVEICDLQETTTYKFYVRRALVDSKFGDGSEVQLFTTLQKPISQTPTDVSAHNISSTSIVVQWQPPSVPNMELTGYEVLYRARHNASAHWDTTLTCNRTLNVTLKNLEKYTEYEIKVSAFNKQVPGNFSDVVTCFTDEDIPLGGPVIISANATSSTSINITWSPVSKPLRLGIITMYIFNLTDVLTGAKTMVSFSGASVNGEVKNLSKYQEYNITGAAVNSKGQSNFTNVVTCRTGEDAPDLWPANLTGYNASSTSITVEFQAYSPEQLNGIIRKYVFRVFRVDVVNSTVWIYTFTIQRSRRRRAISDNNVITKTLTDLEEYANYSIQASFVTVAAGPKSPVIYVYTDEGVPRSPPLQVNASNTSSSSILVTWQEMTPSSVPGILLGYVLRIINADDTNASNFRELENILSTNRNITNLETYTLYNISVAGYTRAGTGNFTKTQCWTDEEVPEGPPNNLTGIAASATSIKLSWLPVIKELRKGIIRGYQAKIVDDNGVTINITTVQSLSINFGDLEVYSNYSLQARAFTRKGFGPWSALINATTGAPAPEQTPTNATAQATGSYTIHVTWSPVSVADPRSLHGYRVLYFPVFNPNLLMEITVGRNEIEASIIGLKPFTLYGVQIAAFSTEDGNYTTPVYAKTWEGAPSAPPSSFGVSGLDSQSLLVYWVNVPQEHRNGIIRGYRVRYWRVGNSTSSVITKRKFSVKLTPLLKATEYAVEVWAFNNAGEGISALKTTWTGEDVPSRPPSNIRAQNRTSLTSIPISWEPVPQEFTHGSLVGYRVTYQAVAIGDLLVEYEPVISEDFGHAVTFTTLENLEPLVVYRITVAAISNKGPGPAGVTFGETCRCRQNLTTSWRNYPPYVNLTSLNTPGIIIPKLLTGVIKECCAYCLEHGESKLDFRRNGNNGIAQRNRSEDLLHNIDGQTDFSFPVIGHKLQDSYKGGLGYSPFVESAGVAFIVYTDTSGVKDAMFDALLACWPVIVLPLVMAYIAGVTVWILDANSNSQHFPTSFIHGTWEGVWWAFVSMTTVGYGDRTPMSHLGRTFAVAWVLTGLVIISVTMGALTTALTTITSHSETTIYGSKVGAIHGSPEYNLGVRRNALMNIDKDYYTLEELSEALINREVDGILIDTYAGGTHKDLFSKPSIRVAQIIDYQTAYGVVIGGDSMRLRHCFYGYMRSHQAEIFKWVEQLVEPITGSGVSHEEIVQDISTGLFDNDADLFHNTLLITSTMAATGVILGLLYEVVRRIRGREKVQQDNTMSVHKDKMIEEMRLIVEDFFQHAMKTFSKMRMKHKKELLQYAKLEPKREQKRVSTMSGTSIHSRDADDISVIALEDLRLNGTKC